MEHSFNLSGLLSEIDLWDTGDERDGPKETFLMLFWLGGTSKKFQFWETRSRVPIRIRSNLVKFFPMYEKLYSLQGNMKFD